MLISVLVYLLHSIKYLFHRMILTVADRDLICPIARLPSLLSLLNSESISNQTSFLKPLSSFLPLRHWQNIDVIRILSAVIVHKAFACHVDMLEAIVIFFKVCKGSLLNFDKLLADVRVM